MTDILGFPGTQIYWRDRCHWFSEAFRAEVDSLLKDTQPVMLESYVRDD